MSEGGAQKLSSEDKEYFNAIFKKIKTPKKIHDEQNIEILNKKTNSVMLRHIEGLSQRKISNIFMHWI